MKCLIKLLIILSFSFTRGANPYCNYSDKQFLDLPAFHQEIDISNVDAALIEAGVFFLTNSYRSSKKIAPLQYQENLSDAAYLHSEQMQMHHFFDHTNRKNKALFTLDKRVEYVNYLNYSYLAENIFLGYVDLRKPGTYKELCEFIVQNFIESQGHKENLLAKEAKELGCGIYFNKEASNGYWYFYFTQDFGA